MWNLLALCSCEIFGNCQIKKYSETHKTEHLLIGLVGYALMIFFLIQIFRKNKNMMYINTLWQAAVIVLGSLIAYAVFGDKFTHPCQYLGILFALLAIYFINWEH